MNRVLIDLEAMRHNIHAINGWMAEKGATWTLVTKVLCGHTDTLRALYDLGVRSVADSRLTNLQAIDDIVPRDVERWYLRLPHASAIPRIIRLTDVSLNSEMEIIEALDEEARRQERLHRIIVMIELGDLREGILPGSLIKFYQDLFRFENIEVLGIGANLGCLSGAIPSIDQFTQLALYRELLELKFERKLSMISAGTSAVIPLLLEGSLPRTINHFRIGEAAFLGTDLVNGGTIEGLRADVITLEAEVVELKKKGLVPLGETTTMTPFEPIGDTSDTTPGQRGYRAVVTLGQLDTEVSGLTPLDPGHQIAGASSDLSVINLGDDPGDVSVGDSLRFRPNYAATVRLMSNRYIDQIVTPSPEVFADRLTAETRIAVPPNIHPHRKRSGGPSVVGLSEGGEPS
jgi:predicted amino acid racemase